MARNIVIDEDTEVGYLFPTKEYYVINKLTETRRLTSQGIKEVLDIVAPNNEITLQQLQDLATTLEPLNSLSFTWDITGTYIATIQLNTYKENPLTLNTDKHILYVMNSNISFDLTLTEGERNRLDILQRYYRDTLGLDLALEDLRVLYRLFISYYNPHTSNTIIPPTTKEERLRYSNYIKLADYRGTSPATYTLHANPTNSFSQETLANILQLYKNQITLESPIQPLHVGDKVRVTNTTQTTSNFPITCDGVYTVAKQLNNTIEVVENFPTLFIQPTLTCNIVAYKSPITEVNREGKFITLSSSTNLNNFLIGDVITLHGTSIETEYETLTVDGTYTITSIEEETITIHVEEIPLTNYTFTGTEEEELLLQPFIYKSLSFGNALNISSNIITLTNPPTLPLPPSTPIEVNKEFLVVDTVEGNIVTTTTIPLPYNPTRAELQQDIPFPYYMINVESTTKPHVFPTGEFMLDSKEQANQYISLLPSLLVPTTEQYNNIGKYVPQQYPITLVKAVEVNSVQLLGLYSEVYEGDVKL